MSHPLRHISELARTAAREHAQPERLLELSCACAARLVPAARLRACRLLPGDELRWEGGRRGRLDDLPGAREALEAGATAVVEGRTVTPLRTDGSVAGFLVGELAPGATLDPDARAALDALGTVAGALLHAALELEELRHVGELKSQFIALASHELRGPVGVLHGIGATLHERAGELTDDQSSRLRKALVDQTGHMSQLVHQLLDLSRLDAGAIRLERAPFPVRDRVEEVLRLVAPERAGEVEIDIPAELEAVADPAALDRIVSNLVGNALRYGRPPVRVSARQLDTHFRLVVEDRGEGIPEGFRPRLFERFARGAADEEGTGLGLAIAQSYAQAHGGELLYEEAEPTGARFELVLPTLRG